MSIADIGIVAAVLLSVVVGFFRGFVKEAISVASLVVAAWAALQFAPLGGSLVEGFIGSEALQMWVGRALIFFAVLLLGGLAGWGVSYLINKGGLTGTDRVLGMGFGFCRGALIIGVIALAANYLGFSQDQWWRDSRLVPYAERVGEAIKALTPRALEYLKAPVDEPAIDAGNRSPTGNSFANGAIR